MKVPVGCRKLRRAISLSAGLSGRPIALFAQFTQSWGKSSTFLSQTRVVAVKLVELIYMIWGNFDVWRSGTVRIIVSSHTIACRDR